MKQIKTIHGLKQRAKKLKKEQGIKHCVALDVAAKESGFENYRDAVNKLDGTT